MRQQQPGTLGRDELVAGAVRLVTASVMLGALSGTLSVITGLRDGSLGESAVALARGSHPGTSAVALASAAVSLAVLAPLAVAKRGTGQRMSSRALMGDGALSGIGAATSLIQLDPCDRWAS